MSNVTLEMKAVKAEDKSAYYCVRELRQRLVEKQHRERKV
ncbi:hypothetical protein Z043_126174 [Scleropages formosus]|uniref:Uncharacterized protein n=1 Tax=Scleropages formosus TaxID=113540 RepID=A0A0P7W0X3_SCLFO|nr:hypothetical protein Z043_126174 [Scleropages formosus]